MSLRFIFTLFLLSLAGVRLYRLMLVGYASSLFSQPTVPVE